MSNVAKPQRKFLLTLLTTLMCLRGKANFRNLSRYSDFNEKSYSRWDQSDFDFVEFNSLGLAEISHSDNMLVAAIDCSFINKSGSPPYGIDKFYNGKQGKAEKGLEISTLAIVDVDYNTAYNLSTRQTPVKLINDETRINQYVAHLQQDRASLPQGIRYLVADG